MYRPTLLPATGSLALFWGIATQNWLVVAVAIVTLVIVATSFVRLKIGERKLRKGE